MPPNEIVRLAIDQHGLITRTQAIELGMSDRSSRTQLANGAWRRSRQGVYVVGAAAPSWDQEVHSACLAAGGDATASHRSAARLWGLVERSGRIEIQLQDHRRVRLPGVTVHRSVLIEPRDIVRPPRDVPRTSVARTIVDLAPTHPPETVGGWIDLGLRDLGLDLLDMVDCCNRLSGPGRPAPISAMRAVARRMPGHDPGRSAFESRVIVVVAAAGLPEPVRQHPVRRPDGTMAYIDLAYPRWKIAIELDGWATHGVRGAFERDRIRGNDLVLLGWTLLRFTWHMPDGYIVTAVRNALPSHLRPGA